MVYKKDISITSFFLFKVNLNIKKAEAMLPLLKYIKLGFKNLTLCLLFRSHKIKWSDGTLKANMLAFILLSALLIIIIYNAIPLFRKPSIMWASMYSSFR